MIMPAFGAYTGSLNVLDRAYAGLFRLETLVAYMLGAERIFAGTYITEPEVRERALAWVPEVMRFASTAENEPEAIPTLDDAEEAASDGSSGAHEVPRELAA